jgi:hypothetical protein
MEAGLKDKDIDSLIQKEKKIIRFSALTILSAAAGPASFILVANQKFPLWIGFVLLFGFCLLAARLQWKRVKLSKQTERKPHRYQVGDEVVWKEDKKYVIIKHGFNHYYLKPIDGDRLHLVARRQIELD